MSTLIPKSLRARLKPLAASTISRFWLLIFRLRFGKRVRFGANFETNGRLVVRGPGRVIFGDNIRAWAHAEKNVFITYRPESVIRIGSGTRLNGAGVMAYTTITFGDRCILGSTVVFDSDFHPLDPKERHNPEAPVSSKPITVGDNVWLGGQTAVLKGVTIGENSVVAFRAVVASDVPANVVVGGNPAKVIKRFEDT